MTMQEQLRVLVERHLVNLAGQLATVTELLTANGEGETLPVAKAVEAEEITHQVKGTAGSMGFADIGTAASALDECLKVLRKSPGPITAAQLQPALELHAVLRRITEATTPNMSSLYNADVSKLAR